jgi:ketosteroid isomerase-like protein
MSGNAGTFLRGWFGRLEETGWTAEVFLAALAEDLIWTATGTSPISGTYCGRDAYVEGIYRRLDERLATWPRPQVERIVADGEWGMVEFSSSGGLGKNGTDYNMRYCWIIHVVDDRVTEVVGYFDTQKVTALFA